jgi:hypothetical protein
VQLYLSLANSWDFFDNSERGGPRLIAVGERAEVRIVEDRETWRTLSETYDE